MSCTVPRETRGEVHLSDSETLRLGDAMSCWGSAAGWGWSLVGTHTHTRRHTRRSRPRHAHTHTAHTGDRTATGHDGTHAAARRGAVPVRSHGSRLSTRMETVGINEREKISTRCALPLRSRTLSCTLSKESHRSAIHISVPADVLPSSIGTCSTESQMHSERRKVYFTMATQSERSVHAKNDTEDA